MQNILKEKKYFLILVVFVAFGALLLSINPIKESFKVAEDEAVKEETSISSRETDTKEDDTSMSINFVNRKQDNFNQAVIDGDKYFLSKDYQQSIIYYKEALKYVDSHIAYARLFNTYNVIGDTNSAIEIIDKAIALKPSFVDYWNTKIQYLDDKTTVSFAELKAIYIEGLSKVDPKSKINLVTHFARLAENSNEKEEAMALWQKAIEINPSGKAMYQAEIDALK